MRWLAAFVLLYLAVPAAAQGGEVITLWPGAIPGSGGPAGPEKIGSEGSATGSVSNVTVPRMVVVRPKKPNGAAVLVIGGGGYFRIQIGSAAMPTAQWLAGQGITAFVLYYRLPGDGWNADAPFQYGERAMRVLRGNWKTLVDGPQDLPAVHKIQDQLRLSGPAGVRPAKVYADRHSPALEYFASLAELLKSDQPPATDGVLFGRAAPLGLTAVGGFDPRRFDAAAVAEIEAGVAEARKAIEGIRPGASIQGWTYPRHTLGYFHQDYLFRAAVAVIGLAALPPAEAMYMQPVADKGRIFDGTGPYRMHFPAGQMPQVNAFWSLTMYRPTKDGQFFLVENPIKRYSIGDRTPGLRKNADGSLDLWIARSDPGGDKSANWLPAPADGPFSLSFRAYLPTADFQDGRYRLPALQQV